MRRGILIALVAVPTLAWARPHKKSKKKAAPPPAEKAETPAEPPAETTPTPAAGSAAPTVPQPTVPTGMSPTTKGTGPTTPLSTGTQPATPSGVPAATVPPPASTPEKDVPEAKDVDVDSLRQEYLSLRDELYKSRARANAVASALYSTRITIKLTWGSARYYGVSKASIRLDGATVYQDATGAIASDDGVRFDGYIAPGRHLITFHVDATGKDDDSFTSSTEAQIVVKAVAQKDLVVSAKGKDSGNIAYEWKKSEHGNYGLGIDIGVKTVASAKAAEK